MSRDVSIYYSRIKTGYKTTVGGGTARGVGVSTTDGATSSGGGSTTGVVRTTGAQRVTGIKYWDASANFSYDISIGGAIFAGGITADVSTNKVIYFDETTGELSYGDATGGTTINDLNDVGDVSVGGALIGQILSFNGTDWVPGDASTAGVGTSYEYVDASLAARDIEISNLDSQVTILSQNDIIQDASIAWLSSNIGAVTELTDLNDVQITDVSNNDGFLYNATAGKWNNVGTIDLTDIFYTKYEADLIHEAIEGGTY